MELESCFAHRSPTKQALIMKRIALYDSVLGWLVTAAAEGRLLMLSTVMLLLLFAGASRELTDFIIWH